MLAILGTRGQLQCSCHELRSQESKKIAQMHLFLLGVWCFSDSSWEVHFIEQFLLLWFWKVLGVLAPMQGILASHSLFLYELYHWACPVDLFPIKFLFLLVKIFLYFQYISPVVGESFTSRIMKHNKSIMYKDFMYKYSSTIITFMHSLQSLLPKWVFLIPAFCLFALEEYALFTIVDFLLPSTASKLRSGNNSFKDLQNIKNPQHVLILVHGNRFNECQFLIGKDFFEGVKRCEERSFLHDTVVLTVNYFSGEHLRDHTIETSTIEGCSEKVVNEIQYKLNQLGIKEEEVTFSFIGHSLGAVVSSYISEVIAPDLNWEIGKVINISGPFQGAKLLDTIRAYVPSLYKDLLHGSPVFLDLHPASKKLQGLRDLMSKRIDRYHFFSGRMDFLVFYSSGLPNFVQDARKTLYDHAGHHNIKMSWILWSDINEVFQQFFSKT